MPEGNKPFVVTDRRVVHRIRHDIGGQRHRLRSARADLVADDVPPAPERLEVRLELNNVVPRPFIREFIK